MKVFLLLVALAILNPAAYADEPSSAQEFYLEKDLVDKIYGEKIAENNSAARQNSSRLAPTFGVLLLDELSLSTSYFDLDYTDSFSQVPVAGITFTSLMQRFTKTVVSGELRAGFLHLQEDIETESASGLTQDDSVTLIWVPLNADLKLEYESPYVSPALILGSGLHWLDQSGKMDGISQTYWAPVYAAGAGLTFFKRYDGTFGGITLESLYQASLKKSQKIAMWDIRIGAQLLL